MSTTAPIIPGETPGTRAPLVLGDDSFHKLSGDVSGIVEAKPTPKWLIGLVFSASILLVMASALVKLVSTGIGTWGLDNTVFWAWDITGFVFWIGIGHAGTLISAILFLFRQKWRTAINRAAEAMTIFAVMAAGIYPAFHVGRVWFLYWVFPVPNQMSIWPNFKSPLFWDVCAVSTYFTVSFLFWFTGLVPDIATVRDRAKSKLAYYVYGVLSLGWRGSHRQWLHYEKAYTIFAGISFPLVLSVHSVVSMDFATSVIPGWHTTIFPPYFVAGAIFSGFGMVLTLMILARKLLGLEHILTIRHLENMCKIILLTGSIVGYAYGMEFFIAWYSGNLYEKYQFLDRAFGPYKWAYWTMISCNVIFPQLFWFKKVRTNIAAMFVLSIIVNIGMWFERFVIIVISLHRDFVPSSWTYFRPSVWDIALFLGTFGLFLTMFLLFCKFLPVIALGEVKGITPRADPHPSHGEGAHEEGAHDEAHDESEHAEGEHADHDHDAEEARGADEEKSDGDEASGSDDEDEKPVTKKEGSSKKKGKQGSSKKSKKEGRS